MIKQIIRFGAATVVTMGFIGGVAGASPHNHDKGGNTTVTIKTTVNKNVFSVSSFSIQGCSTGDASVSHNTTAGDATSGDCSNTNSVTVTANLTN
jgi:hypothetical protein